MASGHLCLNLSERVSWERFDAYAEGLLRELGGTRLKVVAESVEMKIWAVSIRGQALSLVFSDYPAMVSLESPGEGGDSVLQEVHSLLETPASET